jgi:hypothetical protein
MKERKKVNWLDVQAAERIKLRWQVRRQVQQEILQEKLTQFFLTPYEMDAYIRRYPDAMQPMIKDFMRKAEEQTRLHRY